VKELIKNIGFVVASKQSGPPVDWDYAVNGDWTHAPPGLSNQIYAYSLNNYIDLAGLSLDDKTTFIEAIALSYDYLPTTTDGVTGDSMSVSVLVTDIPLPTSNFIQPGGMFGPALSSQNFALHQLDNWTITTDTASWGQFPVLTHRIKNVQPFATASDRLYVSVYVQGNTKVVGVAPLSTITSFTFPSMQVKLLVNTKEEPEYQYLMRLKRSYDLQQSFDED